ncbi:ornithine decarboxylase antizyme-domain-containing protein [Annulohypoxylon maeteangense]|uniref:ornithine decarboxylase antizyme-domain-containing protein n=1 Tax=Annulohypoxylon maeteangense TaxID=1927788 RepID=UPI0020080D82|nr:ornithine decarboxylase antizyme-domain-containing protein [Annulohypoxylon maeteangense]KAI0881749.1 ornithine decarboxylase antizyme-domain-containing protein [Annulohypoxylon maeteangense]
MAPMKNDKNNFSSSNYGEAVSRQVNVLASCYLVDPTASLKGLHYCTTGAAGKAFYSTIGIPEVPISGLPSPPSSPPLAAFTSSNELALQPKNKKRSSNNNGQISRGRRGGATLQIREECERFFCETMKSVFQVEWNMAGNGSCLTGVNNYALTPPDDYPSPQSSFSDIDTKTGVNVNGWMEFWDYAGGASFRAFVAEDGDEKSLFAFFDDGLVGRDLKQALIALIELADGPVGASHVVICVDRKMPADYAKALMRSLQWVGFDLTTLDHWAKDIDVTSNKWLFMGMEV